MAFASISTCTRSLVARTGGTTPVALAISTCSTDPWVRACVLPSRGAHPEVFCAIGLANAQRSLDYIRIIAEFMSQPQYRDVLVMFGITNEPFGPTMGQENLSRYYVEAYNIVRTASGSGVGPTVSFHDGFLGLPKWAGFVPGADNVALDYHPYVSLLLHPFGAFWAVLMR